MIKKFFAVMTALILTLTLFSACEGGLLGEKSRLNVVCTVFPQYDWTRSIIGDVEGISLTLLLDSGTDLHSYQPTAEDIVTISEADIFIYTGGESDKWVEEVLNTSKNEKTQVINLMESLGEDNLYCVESIGEVHEHEDGEEHNHTHDEHIWLSLKNASLISELICNVLSENDAEYKEAYELNLRAYSEKLSALNKRYENMVANADKNTVVVADRFPFIYLVKDYGILYHAAFSGCSAESEASFETVKRLAQEIDINELNYIIITETSDGSVANTVKNATQKKNQEILTINSIQSVTKDKLNTTYLEIMEENLITLSLALS